MTSFDESSLLPAVVGDLLLWKGARAWYEQVIEWADSGPFVHVSIVCDPTHHVEATPQGIRCHTLPGDDATLARIFPVHMYPYTDEDEHIAFALDWARMKVTQAEKIGYGWADILYQAVKFLAPNNPFRLGQVNHWDCSDFVTRYLIQAGVRLPDAFSDPYTNTPNDIARLFGLLPPRREQDKAVLPLHTVRGVAHAEEQR